VVGRDTCARIGDGLPGADPDRIVFALQQPFEAFCFFRGHDCNGLGPQAAQLQDRSTRSARALLTQMGFLPSRQAFGRSSATCRCFSGSRRVKERRRPEPPDLRRAVNDAAAAHAPGTSRDRPFQNQKPSSSLRDLARRATIAIGRASDSHRKERGHQLNAIPQVSR